MPPAHHPRLTLAAMLLLLLGPLLGCATPPPANDPEAVADFNEANDPLEPTNRVLYKINDGLDTILLRPAALTYQAVVPEPVRTGVHNILSNLNTPVQLGNDVLEAKPRRAGDTTMRFLINTTLGVVGIFDVAKKLGYPNHDTDFGLTLALWGVPDGPFLFLPVLGPSNPRDAVGRGVDIVADPFTWVGHGAAVKALNWTRYVLTVVDARSQYLDAIDSIKKTALDPYATFRSLYRQHRTAAIEAARDDDRGTLPIWFPQPQAAPKN
jgi:phospholipid-binding lipoprotein MlaA